MTKRLLWKKKKKEEYGESCLIWELRLQETKKRKVYQCKAYCKLQVALRVKFFIAISSP